VDALLTSVEARVLGSLVEKEITTPDYYPLSLNALVNACNQKSNRDPVMALDEDTVQRALRSLNLKELAGPADTTDSRVTKYEHRLQEAFNFDRRETAILCELLIRGPQTPGELRARAERMHRFDDLGGVQATLQRLAEREPPLVKILPKPPGTKEARYAHLLCGDVPALQDDVEAPGAVPAAPARSEADRIARIEDAVQSLRSEVAEIRREFASFRKQFE
jgi:uncharacterized protein